MATAEEPAQVHRVALKIPPFWADEPDLWFAQLESQFTLGQITQDSTKYAYVLAHIDTKHAKEIKDLITRPPATNKYESLKKALIQRLSLSQEQQIRQLLEQEEIGDRRPSQFLRHLQSLASTAIPEQLLRTLWMGRLPSQIQAILATRIADNLDEVAEQADRVYEVAHKSLTVASVQPPATSQHDLTLEQQIQALTKQVASLNKRLAQGKNMDKSRRERSRSRSRKPKQKESEAEDICYYHRRFKEEARKCTKPCAYKKKEEEN